MRSRCETHHGGWSGVHEICHGPRIQEHPGGGVLVINLEGVGHQGIVEVVYLFSLLSMFMRAWLLPGEHKGFFFLEEHTEKVWPLKQQYIGLFYAACTLLYETSESSSWIGNSSRGH